MDGLVALVTQHGALLVFLATLAARIGLPVPAAPVLVVAGALGVPGGVVAWLPMAAAAQAANLLGDTPWLLPDSCVRPSESFILRWGGSALIAASRLLLGGLDAWAAAGQPVEQHVAPG